MTVSRPTRFKHPIPSHLTDPIVRKEFAQIVRELEKVEHELHEAALNACGLSKTVRETSDAKTQAEGGE